MWPLGLVACASLHVGLRAIRAVAMQREYLGNFQKDQSAPQNVPSWSLTPMGGSVALGVGESGEATCLSGYFGLCS